MEIEEKEVGNIGILRPLAKRIDASRINEFKDKIAELIDEGKQFIVLDLSLVEFMDSSGLGAIIGQSKVLKSKKGDLLLCGFTSGVMNLFKLTGMDKIFAIFPDEESALKSLEGKAL